MPLLSWPITVVGSFNYHANFRAVTKPQNTFVSENKEFNLMLNNLSELDAHEFISPAINGQIEYTKSSPNFS